MKKILIITDNLADQINGVVTTYKNLQTCALLDGYQFVYITPGDFRYVSCPGYPEVKLALATGMAQKIKAMAADYIHIATEGPVGLCARIYLTKHNIKYNTAYHTRFPEGLYKLLNIPKSLTWQYIRWFHKHTGKCLTTTATVKQQLELHGLNNVVTWTRGVDTSIFNPKPQKHKQLTTLLCVSRVSAEKSLEDFCQLRIPNTRKILVGDGPQLAYLQQHYQDVIFTGYKTGDELAEYYQQADVFVFTSSWDTFGIVMLEAIACGTPIAAYPVPGPQDIVEPGVNGYLDHNLTTAVNRALLLNRSTVHSTSKRWTWQNCWQIFHDNLVSAQ